MGRGRFALQQSDSARGNSLQEGEIEVIVITNEVEPAAAQAGPKTAPPVAPADEAASDPELEVVTAHLQFPHEGTIHHVILFHSLYLKLCMMIDGVISCDDQMWFH